MARRRLELRLSVRVWLLVPVDSGVGSMAIYGVGLIGEIDVSVYEAPTPRPSGRVQADVYMYILGLPQLHDFIVSKYLMSSQPFLAILSAALGQVGTTWFQ